MALTNEQRKLLRNAGMYVAKHGIVKTVFYYDKQACALGALRIATNRAMRGKVTDEWYQRMQWIDDRFASDRCSGFETSHIEAFNDHPETTADDVASLLMSESEAEE